MAAILRAVPDERDQKLREWMASVPVVVLVCHILGHQFPDPFSPALSAKGLPPSKRRKHGTIMLEGPCLREIDGESCGTTIRKILDADGCIARAYARYSYESQYRIPAGVLDSGWLSRAQRGRIRAELYLAKRGQSAAKGRSRGKRG